MHTYEGAPDARQAGEIRPSRFRPRYRALSPEELALHDEIKGKAAELEALFDRARAFHFPALPAIAADPVTEGAHPLAELAIGFADPAAEYFADGMKALELAVMWTVKGLTAPLPEGMTPPGDVAGDKPPARPSSAGMAALLADVAAFHAACDVPALTAPAIPSYDRIELRARLIREEVRETLLAMEHAGNLPEIADGLADIIYVAIGTALEFGIPLHRVWAAVHAANMAKVDPATGRVRKRADGKVLKPEGWTPPDIAAAIAPEGMTSPAGSAA